LSLAGREVGYEGPSAVSAEGPKPPATSEAGLSAGGAKDEEGDYLRRDPKRTVEYQAEKEQAAETPPPGAIGAPPKTLAPAAVVEQATCGGGPAGEEKTKAGETEGAGREEEEEGVYIPRPLGAASYATEAEHEMPGLEDQTPAPGPAKSDVPETEPAEKGRKSAGAAYAFPAFTIQGAGVPVPAFRAVSYEGPAPTPDKKAAETPTPPSAKSAPKEGASELSRQRTPPVDAAAEGDLPSPPPVPKADTRDARAGAPVTETGRALGVSREEEAKHLPRVEYHLGPKGSSEPADMADATPESRGTAAAQGGAPETGQKAPHPGPVSICMDTHVTKRLSGSCNIGRVQYVGNWATPGRGSTCAWQNSHRI
jgi:hypothetical protein